MDSDFDNFFRRIKDPRLREIVSLKLQGYTNREIAEDRQLALVTVERRLRQIRKMLDDNSS